MSIPYLGANSQNRHGIPVCFPQSPDLSPASATDLLIETLGRVSVRILAWCCLSVACEPKQATSPVPEPAPARGPGVTESRSSGHMPAFIESLRQ